MVDISGQPGGSTAARARPGTAAAATTASTMATLEARRRKTADVMVVCPLLKAGAGATLWPPLRHAGKLTRRPRGRRGSNTADGGRMGVSVDGYIAHREGAFGWGPPSEEQFRFHLRQVASSAAICGAAGSTKPCCRGRRTRRCAPPSSVRRSPMRGALCPRSSSAAHSTASRATPGSPGPRWPRMFRYPVAVGGGTPFLPPVSPDVPLVLVETLTFGWRVVYEPYRRGPEEAD